MILFNENEWYRMPEEHGYYSAYLCVSFRLSLTPEPFKISILIETDLWWFVAVDTLDDSANVDIKQHRFGPICLAQKFWL